MLRVLAIAIGNPLRRDDGVAHRLLISLKNCDIRAVLQLTPELAEEIAGYAEVIFIDADAAAEEPRIDPIAGHIPSVPLTHSSSPREIVALARAFYGFSGHAFLCHIPAWDLSAGEGLSAAAEGVAEAAVAAINAWVESRS